MPGTPQPADHTARLIDALAQTAFVTMGALTRLAAVNDLSLTQLRVLAILRDRRLRITDLVDHLGLEKSTLSGLISRAEARGLVERAPNATDRRATDVALTAAGRALAATLEADVAAALGPLVTPLLPAEQRTLGELLGKALGVAA